MRTRTLPAIAGVLTAGTFAAQALAGAASDAANAHFAAIAAGDVGAITRAYDDEAVFQWVGGPLDGTYRGKSEIGRLWDKFTSAQGVLTVQVANIQENGNPKGSTVSADVKFIGERTIPVRYVLTFRGDRLVNEVWQIDPNLTSAY